ncbi:stalk domain-containing protein [Paenibacillus aurantiacus]|uniref:Stalk domain-containing protein n=1 Tax=Paenibacillus aurantiacus TaxID=1936118 RepID=A0ABV5KJ78_9BACL
MRKYLIGGLAGAALMFSAQIIAAPLKEYTLSKLELPILVNGKALSSTLPFLNYQGNTYAPLKAVAEALGVDVKWNNKESRIEIRPTTSIGEFPIHHTPVLKIDNKDYTFFMDASIFHVSMLNGKYYITLTLAADLLNYGYQYGYTITPSEVPLFSGSIQFNEAYPFSTTEVKYMDEDTSYFEITLTSPDKTKHYVLSANPSNIQGAIYHKGMPWIPVDEFLPTFGLNYIIEQDAKNKIIRFSLKK